MISLLWATGECSCCHVIFVSSPDLLTGIVSYICTSQRKAMISTQPCSQKVSHCRISLHSVSLSLQSSHCEPSILILLLSLGLKPCLLFLLLNTFCGCAICKSILLSLATLEEAQQSFTDFFFNVYLNAPFLIPIINTIILASAIPRNMSPLVSFSLFSRLS